MKNMTYEELLIETALADERIIVMTAENRALVRNAAKALGKRFIDTGITEQTLVGMAAGLALRGRVPIIHALAPFLTMRAFEFIRTDVGIARLPVKLSGYIPGFLSDGNGPTHQAIEDVAIMRGIPGMEVYCPADEDDLVKMLPAVWSSEAPSYVRVNHKKGIYTHTPFTRGKAETIREGTDITLLVYGFLFGNALEAADLLEKEGLSVGLVNLRSLKPVDEDMLLRCAYHSRMLVTIEDHLLTGGLYSIVAETLLKHRLTATVLPMALDERWFKPGLLQEVLAAWQGPLPRLCYVTDAGKSETRYYRRVLAVMRHPVTHKRLKWVRVVDYYHASQRVWTMAQCLFGKGRAASSWAVKMLKWLLLPGGVNRVLHSATAHRWRLGAGGSPRCRRPAAGPTRRPTTSRLASPRPKR